MRQGHVEQIVHSALHGAQEETYRFSR